MRGSATHPPPWQLRRERETLEERITELEATLETLTAKLANTADLAPDEIAQLGKQHAATDAELLASMARWEEIVETLSGED